MALLIDGYNLLHAVGILCGPAGPGELERARSGLLNFLAEKLGPSELRETTVVFDSRGAPRGLPRRLKHREMTVCFAAEYVDADEMIEELIRGFPTPRRLVVVSSDHHIQRAARRRKAKAIDSGEWYFELARPRGERSGRAAAKSGPSSPTSLPHEKQGGRQPRLGPEEIRQWLERFGGEAILEEIAQEERASGRPNSGLARVAPDARGPADKLTAEEAQAIGNPFPPGYGEDLPEDTTT
jgi:hypothetical protein